MTLDPDVGGTTEGAPRTVDGAPPAGDGRKDEPSRLLGELAMTAAGIGTYDWDLVTGRLRWDDQLLELFGYAPDTFDGTIEAFESRVHEADRARVHEALQSAIDVCGEYEAEFRVELPTGATRWVSARGRALCDETGVAVRMLGAGHDTTDRRLGDAHLARVLESIPTAFFSLDRAWRFTYLNAEGERLLGRSREELVGGVLWDLFPDAIGSEFESQYRRGMDSREAVVFEAFYPAPLDTWFEVRAWPEPSGLAVYFVDITARHAAQAAAERTARRLALLAEVTAELTEALEAEEAVARLAQLVVPVLADWCIVSLVDDAGNAGARRGLRDVGWWHAVPEQRSLVERYASRRIDALAPGSFLARALDSGERVAVTGGATAAIQGLLRPGEAKQLITRLAPDSVTVLPLRGRGRTVGLLTLFNSRARGPITPDLLETAQEVAGRAGLALDNSRLYRQQRTLAEGLQRSLLTEPVEPDHIEVVVRYEPAGEAAQVGGDWYDAFMQRDGSTVIVIGDVVGHDVVAAAAMGQLRSLVRGIAVATGLGPADLLAEVDRAMRTLDMATIATAIVARVEQRPDELARGICRVRWSNAGHPPPLAINAGGGVALLGSLPDLVLGVVPDTPRVEQEVVLDRGTTVLFYTDGLVERRRHSVEEGIERLRDVVVELAEHTLDDLCDQVLARMLPGRPDDDVALVAVRLHRQDRPRPAEAGPERIPADVPVRPSLEGTADGRRAQAPPG